MLLAILSDTHGHVPFTQAAIDEFESLDIDAMLHCGDIGSVGVVRLLARWRPHFVFGNVDGNESELRSAIAETGGTCHERWGAIELAGRRIAFLHGDDGRRLRETIASGECDLVCSGHTHRMLAERHGRTLALNPGALYRANPRSFALVELPSLAFRFVELRDVE